ncbi:diacylglycerol kinase [Paraburkholderia youngii]
MMVTLVMAAELFNTALERLADHLHSDQHPAIGAVKDCAAAAVMFVCAGAALVGILMLVAVLAAR